MLNLNDFDFFLPPELIAQHPLPERSASRLLHVDGDVLVDGVFNRLPSLVEAGDLLVLNNTQVIKARLFGRKDSGGQVEILIERLLSPQRALAQIRASKSPKAGTILWLDEHTRLNVIGRAGHENEFFELELPDDCPFDDFYRLLDIHGALPLPPYISRVADSADEARYQTVFAQHPGAVAAPTAGLHFDENLLSDMTKRGVKLAQLTLHVGAGTFQPVRVQNLALHRMHAERFEIPPETVAAILQTKAEGGRVIAVGTTSLRALEAASVSGQLLAGSAETTIFITPGFRFQVVDRLITNFHLPKSTLLMLVAAFAGFKTIEHAYRHAIEKAYRFFSYGDAMLLERDKNAL